MRNTSEVFFVGQNTVWAEEQRLLEYVFTADERILVILEVHQRASCLLQKNRAENPEPKLLPLETTLTEA